jgi:PPOX class probable F420-dependent enzyme
LGKNFGYLATIIKDGSPQVTPVWVDLDNGYIIVNTAEGRLKHRIVSYDPRVAISVADHANPYYMVRVRGHVVEQTTKGIDNRIDKLAKKYIGVDRYPNRMP